VRTTTSSRAASADRENLGIHRSMARDRDLLAGRGSNATPMMRGRFLNLSQSLFPTRDSPTAREVGCSAAEDGRLDERFYYGDCSRFAEGSIFFVSARCNRGPRSRNAYLRAWVVPADPRGADAASHAGTGTGSVLAIKLGYRFAERPNAGRPHRLPEEGKHIVRQRAQTSYEWARDRRAGRVRIPGSARHGGVQTLCPARA